MWIDKEDFTKWFENNDNEYFYDDIYCYHWHNRNHLNIEVNSPFYRNIKKVLEKLNLEKTIKID
jgi:hypothetical protein